MQVLPFWQRLFGTERTVLHLQRDERFVHTRPESRRVQDGEHFVHRELLSCFLTSGLSILDTPLLSLRFADSGT